MTARRALMAIAVLFCGFAIPIEDVAARSADGRQAKPATRSAAPQAAAAPRRGADATARGSQQRGRSQGARNASGRRQAAVNRSRRGGLAGQGGLSCVPYVRQVTGMDVRGNGRDWWHNAAGRYMRDNRPAVGSVMAFPGSGGMPLGHVAVVERIVSSREVLIHHANWGGPGIRRGSIMRGVSVIDVSDNNDWTRVRVQVGHRNDAYGRVYPVYGFIHNRPYTGVQMAGGVQRGLEEVAEATRRR